MQIKQVLYNKYLLEKERACVCTCAKEHCWLYNIVQENKFS